MQPTPELRWVIRPVSQSVPVAGVEPSKEMILQQKWIDIKTPDSEWRDVEILMHDDFVSFKGKGAMNHYVQEEPGGKIKEAVKPVDWSQRMQVDIPELGIKSDKTKAKEVDSFHKKDDSMLVSGAKCFICGSAVCDKSHADIFIRDSDEAEITLADDLIVLENKFKKLRSEAWNACAIIDEKDPKRELRELVWRKLDELTNILSDWKFLNGIPNGKK